MVHAIAIPVDFNVGDFVNQARAAANREDVWRMLLRYGDTVSVLVNTTSTYRPRVLIVKIAFKQDYRHSGLVSASRAIHAQPAAKNNHNTATTTKASTLMRARTSAVLDIHGALSQRTRATP